MLVPPTLVEKLKEPPALASPEEETDNWDDDFEEGISLTKLQGMSASWCNWRSVLSHK
jgi:hypothetical protein